MITRVQNKLMNTRPLNWVSAGFSLVEIMVGMVVGLITIVVIMQSYASFEGQKRTTTSSSDTLENGLIALQAIESDARTAGYGLVSPKGLACTSMIYYENGLVPLASSAVTSIAPVVITPSGVSDTIIFTTATSPIAGMPMKLNGDLLNAGMDPSIDNSVGFTISQDLFIVAAPVPSPGVGVRPTPCARIAYVSAVTDANAIYNSSDPNFFPVGGYPMNTGVVINIGSGLNGAAGFLRTQYRVNANNDLIMEDVSHFFAQSAVVLASNIVGLQAQYGVAPVNTQPGIASPGVNCWTDPTGNACNSESGNWATPSAADIMRIKAIRLAVVARSPLPEKPSVAGGACDATAASSVTSTASGVVAWPGVSIDLTSNANWRCHRYRVYQTIIPLRNVIWANL